MAKPTIIKISGLEAALDGSLAKLADPALKSEFSKIVSDYRKLMSQSLSEEEKLKKGKSMYMSLRQEGKLESIPTEVQSELAHYFDDEKAQGQQKGHRMSSSQRSNLGHDENQYLDVELARQHSAHSPSQSRKQTGPSGEQENQDRARLQERITRIEQDLDEERIKVEKLERVLGDRLCQIKEKDGELKFKEEEIEHLAKSLEEEKKKYSNASRNAGYKEQIIYEMEMQLKKYSSCESIHTGQIMALENENKVLEKDKHHLEKYMQREAEKMKDAMESVRRKHDDQLKKLVVERDDLRDRFSKLAGAKLQDQNADIADLSDPNRAMKLSERFGQIYDDEWTNAFESLTDKKINISLKDAISLLLRILQDCLTFCNGLVESQMDSLKSVVLHPAQDVSKYAAEARKTIGELKDQPRISSKDEQALRVLRRQIGVGDHVVEEIKQVFLIETKCWGKEKKGYDRKLLETCTPYLQKCAEICWLMVLHDPPLYMKMDSTPGEKFDSNIYTVYSTSGDKIDYIVWPPLYNGRGGGLLSKGSAEPLRTIGKKNLK